MAVPMIGSLLGLNPPAKAGRRRQSAIKLAVRPSFGDRKTRLALDKWLGGCPTVPCQKATTTDRLTTPKALGLFGEFVDWRPFSNSQYGPADSALPWNSDASQFAFQNSEGIWPAPYRSRPYRSDGSITGANSESTIPAPLLISGELDKEDEEKKKLESPAVAAGLIEPGLARPNRLPTFPSIPPVEAPLPEEAPGPSGRGVWDSPPTIRGRTLEQLFGHNLHPNYPTVDIWDPTSGTITSLKSVDLESPSYTAEGRYQGTLYNRLSKYVNDLAEFEGTTYAESSIPKDGIRARVLNVIVPGPGTATQQEVMRRIIGLGAQRGLTITFTIY